MTIKERIPLFAPFLLLGVLGVILFSLLTYMRKPQEVRQRAATPAGTEQLVLTPTSSSIIAGEPTTITLTAAFTGTNLDGIQVVATISGTIPTNLSFTPTAIPGMQIVRNSLLSNGASKRLELAYVSTDPFSPYQGTVTQPLGTFTFTSPRSGSLLIAYNTTLTKMSENKTAADILGIPKEETYVFVTPTPTPTPNPNYCPGPNGSRCEYTVCTPCTGRLCPKNPCRERIGVCRSNVCKPR